MPFAATWTDPESVILSGVSQRRRNIIWRHLYVESTMKWYKWTYKTETDSQTSRTSLWLLEGEEGVRDFEIDMYTLSYLKWISNKDLLCSSGNSAQCYVAAWTGGGFGGEWIHVYIWLSPFIVHLKLSQHCLLTGHIPVQNKKFRRIVYKIFHSLWNECIHFSSKCHAKVIWGRENYVQDSKTAWLTHGVATVQYQLHQHHPGSC